MFSILGELVVMRFTSIGDTRGYQSANVPDHLLEQAAGEIGTVLSGLGNFQASTFITDWIGSKFHLIFYGNPILINNGFQTITFVGLIYLLLSVPVKARVGMAILLMLPSFTLWTSIASKECIVSFCVAIISGYLIRQYTEDAKLNLFHISAISLLYLFKPHYLIAIFYAWCGKIVSSYVKQKALLAYMGLLVSLLGLIVFRDEISELSFTVQWSFEVVSDVRSTRAESFFVDRFDVFYKIPEGFYRSFVGPTLDEVVTSPLHMATFIESLVLIVILALALLRRIRKIPVYNFVIGVGVSFWILFPNYPFGVMNSGSAIRYRSGWIILLFVAVTVLTSRDLLLIWRRRQEQNRSTVADQKYLLSD
jgi:hypothetical protein